MVAAPTGMVDLKKALGVGGTGEAFAAATGVIMNPLPFEGFLLVSGDDADGRQWSQELRFDLEASDRVLLMGGISAWDEEASRTVPVLLNERVMLGVLTGFLNRRDPTLRPQAAYDATTSVAAQVVGLAGAFGTTLSASQAAAIAANFPTGHVEDYTRGNRTKAWDVYMDGTWRATEKLELQAGVRFTRSDRSSRFASTVADRSILTGFLAAVRLPEPMRSAFLAGLAVPGANRIPTSAAFPLPMFGLSTQPTATAVGDRGGLEDEGLGYRLTGRYALSDAANVYAVYSRGRRPRVLAANAPTAPGGAASFTSLSAETLDSYEVGYKGRNRDLGLEADISVYAYQYRHFQTQVQRGTLFVQTDAGQADAYGVEGQLRWDMSDRIRMFSSYSLSHARFGPGLYEGNHFRLTPDQFASVGAEFRWRGRLGEAYLIPTYTRRSRIYFDNTNGNLSLITGALVPPVTYQAFQPGYGVAGLSATFKPTGERWSFEAFADNLLDKRYLRDTGAGSLFFGLPTYVAAPPRTIGFAVRYR